MLVLVAHLKFHDAGAGAKTLHGVFFQINQVAITGEVSGAAAVTIGVSAAVIHFGGNAFVALAQVDGFKSEPAPIF